MYLHIKNEEAFKLLLTRTSEAILRGNFVDDTEDEILSELIEDLNNQGCFNEDLIGISTRG